MTTDTLLMEAADTLEAEAKRYINAGIETLPAIKALLLKRNDHLRSLARRLRECEDMLLNAAISAVHEGLRKWSADESDEINLASYIVDEIRALKSTLLDAGKVGTKKELALTKLEALYNLVPALIGNVATNSSVSGTIAKIFCEKLGEIRVDLMSS